jgi:hypothetical protein
MRKCLGNVKGYLYDNIYFWYRLLKSVVIEGISTSLWVDMMTLSRKKLIQRNFQTNVLLETRILILII